MTDDPPCNGDPFCTTQWASDAGGAATGEIVVDGFQVTNVLGRTIVAHASADGADNGARISCGVIYDGNAKSGEQACGENTAFDTASGMCVGTASSSSSDEPTAEQCSEHIEETCASGYDSGLCSGW